MAKGRVTKDMSCDESCNKMREQRGKERKVKYLSFQATTKELELYNVQTTTNVLQQLLEFGTYGINTAFSRPAGYPAKAYLVSSAGLGRGVEYCSHGGLTRIDPPEIETAKGWDTAGG
ncbi:hypothetical protein YC2023_002750 [Brassica napus]